MDIVPERGNKNLSIVNYVFPAVQFVTVIKQQKNFGKRMWWRGSRLEEEMLCSRCEECSFFEHNDFVGEKKKYSKKIARELSCQFSSGFGNETFLLCVILTQKKIKRKSFS